MRRGRWVTVLLVAPVAGCAGAGFKAVPLPVPARDWEDIGHDLTLLAENRDVFSVPAGA